MQHRKFVALVGVVLLLGACATRVDMHPVHGTPQLKVQNRLLLTPVNGGQAITGDALRPGDIILSSTNSLNSLGIRALTVAPVSHAALYVGDGQVAEAVGSGIRTRNLHAFMNDESVVVAFRHPGVTHEHANAMHAFAREQEGKKYNTAGVVLQAPFILQRQFCELPLTPSLVRDACIRGIAAIQLGAARNDRFFCSQFVLEAYRRAKLPLTAADPLLVSPADLLHMREGDVPSIHITQALQYVGHLKADTTAVDAAATARGD